MTPPPTITAWAIKAPDGKFVAIRLSESHMNELLEYLRSARGNSIVEGYRCVRVQITEVQE